MRRRAGGRGERGKRDWREWKEGIGRRERERVEGGCREGRGERVERGRGRERERVEGSIGREREIGGGERGGGTPATITVVGSYQRYNLSAFIYRRSGGRELENAINERKC